MNLKEQPVMTNTDSYGVSDRYNVINTLDVVEQFSQYGFEITSVQAAGTRDLAKIGKQKHMVRMKSEYKMVGGLRPEVILTNSYDGTRALNIQVGLFRMVCSNGIIVGTNLIPKLQILHSNTHWEEMINEFVDTYDEKYHLQQEWVQRMEDTRMTLDEAYILAKETLEIRHSDQRIQNDAVDPLELLVAKRKEDRGNTAWHRFNVLQESLVNGFYHKYDNQGEIRKAKIMTNVDELVRLNTNLSDLFDSRITV